MKGAVMSCYRVPLPMEVISHHIDKIKAPGDKKKMKCIESGLKLHYLVCVTSA